MAVAADKFVTIGIDTALTAELKSEGLAREVVRRIQDLRKKAGFNIEDRINTWHQTSDELAQVFQDWGDYIAAETLTICLQAGTAPEGAYTEQQQIDGLPVILAVKQTDKLL